MYKDKTSIPNEAVSFSTVNELVKHRAASKPEQAAFTFLTDGEAAEERLTYAGLECRARGVAARLQELAAAGERVLLLYPPGLDYIAAFFGCLYAGAIAVPAYPPRRKNDAERVHAILKDADVSFVMTSATVAAKARSMLADVESLRWITTDGLSDNLADRWQEPAIDPDHIAFLQYTSGSTSAPRGVMVTHANLLCNERMIGAAFRQTEASVIVGWLPLYHDMGLIGTVIQPLFAGASSILMSPASFLQKPVRWLQAITRYRATTSGGPNFAYDLCARRITDDQCAALDLSSWQVAFNGAEPVRGDSLDRFAERFRQAGFRRETFAPCYGLAEATLLVSGGVRESGPLVAKYESEAMKNNRAVRATSTDVRAVELVSCGGVQPGIQLMIVDPETCRPCPAGTVGEIWTAGPNVARGYWGRAQETRETFAAYLSETGEGPFLRTGDLGFMADGELFVTGRLKDLIIIRGRNHYPQDIELTVERSHPAFKPGSGSAFSLEVAGQEQLAIVQEVAAKPDLDLNAAIESVRRAIAEQHEIQPHAITLIRVGTIPKTSSGKIQRRACRSLLLNRSLHEIRQWTLNGDSVAEPAGSPVITSTDSLEEIEHHLIEYLSARLGISPAEIESDLPLTSFGLDSLALVELAHTVESHFGVEAPLTVFYDGLTIADLAVKCFAQICSSRPAVGSEVTADGAEVEYPLSRGQEALYFLHQLSPESPAYNIANAVRIRGVLDAEALRAALQSLMNRHAALRTTFCLKAGKPVQRVREHETISFSVVDARGADEREIGEQLSREARRPFRLEQGPLMRVMLFARSPEEHILLLVIHHIVADFWSLAVLARELGILYSAEKARRAANVQPLVSSYERFVSWQAELLAGAEGERLRNHWLGTLTEGWQPLNLPTDRPRPPLQTFNGASRWFSVDAVTADRLRAIALRQEASLYATLLACFQTFLYRLTGQSDFLVGTPAAARSRAEFASLVGYFVNPVVLRARISPEEGFENLLEETRRSVNLALQHQGYPFAALVEQVQPDRDPSLSPLFQVMFALQKAPSLVEESIAALAVGSEDMLVRLGELCVEPVRVDQQVSQFDLSLMMAETGAGLSACLQYNTDLVDAATIDRFVGNFLSLIESIVAAPSQPLARLSMLTEAEQSKLIREWNDTRRPYSEDLCLHEIIEEQAAKTPENPALIFKDKTLSYRELNGRANQLARLLMREGVGPESLVGMCVERSFEMMIGVLAIMKAGGAYVPLDPDYPAERLAYMMEDANINILLRLNRHADRLTAQGKRIIDLEAEWELISRFSQENVGRRATADNLAYVIYTSGSTGKPKGAMNTHLGIVNRLLWMQEEYGLTESDRVLQKTPMSFDVSVWEMLWPLMQGAAVVLAEPGRQGDSAYLAEQMRSAGVTTLHFVPGMLAMMLEEKSFASCASLKRVICSGEALAPEVKERFCDKMNRAQLSNLYGPTEAAVDVTYWQATPGATVVIGKPIANTQIYILNEEKLPVPVGVAGEIYIAGRGLGRGYLGKADLTAERFIPNPYSQQAGERMYETGDLARYLPDGNIEFLGRIDHQVKIRGFRIELGEIESALRQLPAISEAVVVARPLNGASDRLSNYRVTGEPQAGGDEFRAFLKAGRSGSNPQDAQQRLVAYLIVNAAQPVPTVTELRARLGESLPDYMIPAAFMFLDRLPVLPNGKIDRRALPEPERLRPDLAQGFVAPQTTAEATLARIWSEVLNVDQVGIHDNFFDLGGDSIRSIQVKAKAEEEGLRFTLQDVFKQQTIHELARIAIAEDNQPSPLSFSKPFSLITDEDRDKLPAGVEDAYPLSRVQAGLIFHCQYHPDSAIYHDIFMYRLRARFVEEHFREAIAQVVERHANLRTSFDLTNFSEPLQFVHEKVEAPLTIIDLRGLSEDEQRRAQQQWIESEKRNPIDWTRPPLIRFFVHRRADDIFQLVLSFHDTILDGWSTASMLTELLQRYSLLLAGTAAPAETPPQVSYREFVATERATLESEECKRYWDRKLSDLSVACLPRWNHSGKADEAVGAYDVAIDPETSAGLMRLARLAGVPLKHVLLAAHLRVMSFVSGRRDCMTGLESNGRLERAGGEQTLGVFINIVPFRQTLAGGTWIDLVKETFANETELLPYRRYPLFDLQKARERQTLFEAVFNYTYFHVFKRLQGVTGLEILGARGFEQTNFTLRAEFNQNPFTDLIQLDLVCDLNELTREQVKRIGGYYAATLKAMAADPFARYEYADLLSELERRELALDGNPVQQFTATASLPEMFEAQAQLHPQSVALTYEQYSISYDELNCRANRLAHGLRRCGVRPGDLVGLCLERSPEIVISILAILKSGAAYVPLDPHYPKERIAFMLDDAGISALVTHRHLIDALPSHTAPLVFVDAADGTLTEADNQNVQINIPPDSPAYVIYTSGSTGKPKGVLVSHANVARLFKATEPWYGFNQEDVWTLFHSYAFDFSVWEIWGALLYGGRLVVVPHWMSRSPEAFSELLEKERVTVLNQTPSAFRQLIEAEEKSEAARGLRLRYVIFGGEALDFSSLAPWFARHDEQRPRLINMYGITETTVHVTYQLISAEASQGKTTSLIGMPITDLQVYLFDEHLQLAPLGVAGEIYVGGAGLSHGYLNRPALTAERFIPNPFSSRPGERLYKTGDQARYLPDAGLEYLGRIDHQVKVRGFRIELGEIEAAVRQHPAVREAVVIAREDEPGEKRIVSYIIARDHQPLSISELRTFIAKRLPDYMVPTAFVQIEVLPLTPEGKIDRRALPAPPQSRPALDDGFVAPRTKIEARLARTWSDVLGVERVGIHDNFFDLGGHSLIATQLISRMKEKLNVEVPLRVLFEESSTVAELAAYVEAAKEAGADHSSVSIPPVPREGRMPLSFAQQRLYFMSRMSPDNPFYNMTAAVRLKGQLDIAALEASVNKIIRRHEVLRTTFGLSDGQPVQITAPSLTIKIGLSDSTQSPRAEQDALVQHEIRKEAAKPFDLGAGPLIRLKLINLETTEHVLILSMHHIVSDGWSMGVFIKEMAALYAAFSSCALPALAPLAIQYADYAIWQREQFKGQLLENLSAYWKRKLKGLAILRLPTDFPRPETVTWQGASERIELPADLARSLKELGHAEASSLFMVLLAGFKALLHYRSAQDDIAVGSDVANRKAVETEALIGFFVNQIVLRTDLAGDPTFRTLLSRVRETALAAYAHQDMPFDKLVEVINPPRERNRTPLFQVKFVLQNAPMPPLALPGLELSLIKADSGTAKFDLLFNLWESESGLFGNLEYSTDLFKRETVAARLQQFSVLLQEVVANPDARLSELHRRLDKAADQERRIERDHRRTLHHAMLKSAMPRTVSVSPKPEADTERAEN